MKPTCKTYPDGVKKWWLNGKLHKEWYLNNKLHREDGPAIEWPNGYKEWYLNGKLHRESGPAVEIANGTKAWWLNGIEYSEPDFYRELYKKGKITKEELFIKLL